jgi:hypothetical protein
MSALSFNDRETFYRAILPFEPIFEYPSEKHLGELRRLSL